MNRAAKEELAVRRTMMILEYARLSGYTSKAFREYAVPRASYYQRKKAGALKGQSGQYRKQPFARNHPRQISSEVVDSILHLRRTYHPGPQRITRHFERYNGIIISCSGVYRALARNGMHCLPKKRCTPDYSHPVLRQKGPGQHIQVNVKCLKLMAADGTAIRRFQNTAIDDAARVRASAGAGISRTP